MICRLFSTLIFTLFFSYSIHAISEFEWYDSVNQRDVRINLLNHYFEIKDLNSPWLKKKKITFKDVFLSDLPPYCKANKFDFKSKILISLPGTGQVYQFDSTNNVLERLDKTFFRGYNFHALQFIKNDTLFSLGGEGFWKSNSILSYFDFKNKEWEQVKTFGEIPHGVLGLSAGLFPNQNKVVAIESFHQGEYQVPQLGFYELNLKNRTWSKKGNVNLLELKKLGLSGVSFNLIDKLMFLNEHQLGFFVDSEANQLYKYVGPKNLFFLIESQLFKRGNQIISKQYDKNSPGNNFKIDSMTVGELKKQSKLIGRFYEEEPLFNRLEYFLIGVILCLLISLGINFMFLFKQKKPDNDLRVSNLPFGGQEFIELFNQKGGEYLVSSEEISVILNCEKKAFDTQRQYRAQFINAMNQYFSDNYHIDEAVFRKADEDDKRYMKYGIKKEVLGKLG